MWTGSIRFTGSVWRMHITFAVTAVVMLALGAERLDAAELTLEAAFREALLNNQDLAAERSSVRAAEGRLQQAGLWPNPRIGMSNSSDAFFGNEGEFTRSIELSQDFPITGRIALQRDVARVDVALAQAEMMDAERRLLGSVADAFYAVTLLNQKIDLQGRLVGLNQSLVEVIRNGFKAGEISEFDVYTGSVELERLQQDRAQTVATRAARLAELAALLGRSAGELLEVTATSSSRRDLASLPDLMKQAAAQRPDLRMRELDADRAAAERALARAAAWEDWTVSLGVEQDRLAITGAPRQSSDNALMLSLAVPIPLFNRQQGAQAASVATQEVARARAAALKTRIEQDIAGRHAQLTQLGAALRAYEESTLPLAHKNAELARGTYRQGQVSISNVVLAERQEMDLTTSYIGALTEYYQARVALDTAVNTWRQYSLATPGTPEASTVIERGE